MIDQACSIASKSYPIDPIGTAPTSINALLLVELPAPWHRKITKSPNLNKRIKEIITRYNKNAIRQVRIQAIRPNNDYSRNGFTRLFYFQKTPSKLEKMDKLELFLPNGLLNALPELPWDRMTLTDNYARYLESQNKTRDLLICTHEERDYCCGKFGANLRKILKEKYERIPNRKLRVWETSHLTGHRFAPTILDLPEGRYWAYINEKTLETLIRRNGPVSSIPKNHYRGILGIDSYSQAAEREAFYRNDWAWIDWKKTARLIYHENSKATVLINYESGDKTIKGSYKVNIQLEKTPIRIGNTRCGKQKDIYGLDITNFQESS
ncbi:MAG: sucrase ferredoxin [Candidatus Heimdallarchaeota archaeon]